MDPSEFFSEVRAALGRLLCTLFEHGWRFEPQVHTHGGHTYGPFRACDRCQEITLLHPPGPEHPESTGRPLPPEQEAVLARIASALADS